MSHTNVSREPTWHWRAGLFDRFRAAWGSCGGLRGVTGSECIGRLALDSVKYMLYLWSTSSHDSGHEWVSGTLVCVRK